MQLLGQLTMTIAHDFNNALTSINCNTEMAAETIIDFTQARCAEETEHLHEALEFLSMVTKTSKSAEAFVRQLLAYARQQQLVRGPLNLNDPIRSTSKLFRKVLGECVSVNLILDERLPRVYAERSQIEGVLMNLIVNARDAMPNGGSLTIESSIATIDARFIRRRPWARTGVFVKLSVSDTGIGMDSETLDKIFTLYFTTKENGKGNGLGLPSVYGIIRQHGGYLDVTSAIGHGTQFDLYLPPATADQLTQVTTVRSEHPINTLLPAGKFILIAEADSTVRRLFQQIIRRAGAVPISVSDGERALEIYRRMTERNTPIDVAIIDIGLPGLDGRDVYRRIKLCDPTAAVLLISGYGMRYTESQSTPEEGYEFLHKPFDGFQLLDRINSLITQREEALANHIADGEILPISAVETVF
jgi:CheY-like chemotaxis protein